MFDLSLLLNKHYLIMFEYFAAPSIKIPVLYVNHWRKKTCYLQPSLVSI